MERLDEFRDPVVMQRVATTALVDGVLTQRWKWPAVAVGIPLMVRFSIQSGDVSQTFLYPVKVRAAGT